MNFVKKLDEKQLKELALFTRSNKNKPQEIKRAQAILLLSEKISKEMFYQLTGIKRATAVKIRKQFIQDGTSSLISKKPEKEPRALLKKAELEKIKEMLHKETPRNYGWNWDHWTPSILSAIIFELYGVKYKSKTSLYLIFKKSKFTYHKPEKKYKNRNEKAALEWKQKVADQINAAFFDQDTELLTADEMIITSQTTLQKIWLPEGEYPIVECSNTRKRRSIYGALNIKTGEEIALKTELQNSQTTIRFLKKILERYKGRKIVLVWDNASWHKSAAMKDFLATCSNLKLINFPPYAPELNPQEHVWKAARVNITHNKFISDIDAIARELVNYLSTNFFRYEFFGFTAKS